MAFGDDDVLTMLSDFGVAVVFGGTTVQGIFDTYESRSSMLGGQVDVVERERTVLIKTGSLPGLVNESALSVDGVNYKVRDILQESDGALTRVYVVVP